MNDDVKKYLNLLTLIDHQESAFRHLLDDITMGEYRVLAMVEEKPLILKDVADQRAVAAQGIGRLVERLRKRGFLTVKRKDRDKRAKEVTVSVSGRAMLRRCNVALGRVLKQSA